MNDRNAMEATRETCLDGISRLLSSSSGPPAEASGTFDRGPSRRLVDVDCRFSVESLVSPAATFGESVVERGDQAGSDKNLGSWAVKRNGYQAGISPCHVAAVWVL